MSRRLFRLLLRCYPRSFRVRFGSDMEETFVADLAAARRRGRAAAAGLWLRTAVQAGVGGIADRLGQPTVATPRGHQSARPAGSLLQDVRFGLRSLARNPSFSTVAILTMTLGIGASTAIFSVVNGVLLKPLPYPDSEELVVIGAAVEGEPDRFPEGPLFPSVFAEWQSGNTAFERMAAVSEWSLDLVGEGDPRRLNAAGVSADFLPLLGTSTQLGRNFSAEEDRPGGPAAAILSHRLWQTHWGGDPGILGRRIALSGQPYTVVGVLPPDFRYPEVLYYDAVDVLYPYQLNVPTQDLIHAFGRLRDGVDIAEAEDALNALGAASAARRGLRGHLIPLTTLTVGDVGPRLRLLLAAVALLLLIASANVANLLLARATSRTSEIALRSALGAGRGRIVRQLLTESSLLSLAGGTLGVGFAVGAVRVLRRVDAGDLPRLSEVSLDGTVLGFALVVTAATGLLFGAIPAARLATQRAGSLVSGGVRASPGRWGRRVRASLVATQIGLALVLSVGASLLIESFVRLERVDPGFDPEGVAFASIILDDRYPTADEQALFFSRVLERVELGVPGVSSAGLVTALPMAGDRWRARIAVEGYQPPAGTSLAMDYAQVSEAYFETLRTPVVAGRVFGPEEAGSEGPTAIVVNEAFARQYWPEGDAVGRRLKLGRSVDVPGPWITVIGVVGDVRQRGLAESGEPHGYLFYRQRPSDQMRVVVRSDAAHALVAQAVRRAVWDVDPNVPVDVGALQDQVAGTITAPRFYTLLLTTFAAVALALAAAGIYGTMAYVVGERRREMGVRIALGAGASSVRGLVVRDGLAVATVGVLAGLAGAAVTTRLLEGLLFGITPADPTAYGAGVAVLVGVAAAASYLPARRATTVDPVETLRAE